VALASEYVSTQPHKPANKGSDDVQEASKVTPTKYLKNSSFDGVDSGLSSDNDPSTANSHDIFPMAGRIHFDYMVYAYVAVLAPVTCQAWLEICRVGKSTSHVAQDRAKEYCDTTGIAPREDAI
jgi:hypothetical protein